MPIFTHTHTSDINTHTHKHIYVYIDTYMCTNINNSISRERGHCAQNSKSVNRQPLLKVLFLL